MDRRAARAMRKQQAAQKWHYRLRFDQHKVWNWNRGVEKIHEDAERLLLIMSGHLLRSEGVWRKTSARSPGRSYL